MRLGGTDGTTHARADQTFIADTVRLPSGDGEVVRRQNFRNQVRVWFQGHGTDTAELSAISPAEH